MSPVAVVVPLRPGVREEAARLIAGGPPFPLSQTGLKSHSVYLDDHEAVFVFEGPAAREVVEQILGESDVWRAASEWRGLLDGRPRLAEPAFSWSRAD